MSRRSSCVDEFHDTVEGSPQPIPPDTKTKAKTAPKKKKQTAPIVLRGPDFDSTDINSCVALLKYLADSITSAVQEGKSVTSGNKSLIVAAALEIKELVSSIPSLVAAPPTPTAVIPPSPQRNTEIDIKIEVIAAIRSELNKIKKDTADIKDIVTDLKNTPQPAVANKHNTYAAALATNKIHHPPSFPILVESADPNEDVIKTVKSSVDVVNLGIGINSMRKTKGGQVLVACDDKDGREKLQSAITENNKQLTVRQPAARRPLLRIIGVIQEMSDTQIEEAILRQNDTILAHIKQEDYHLKVQRRTQTNNTARICNVILQVSPGVWRSLVDTRIRLGYQIVPVIDQSPLLQCYRCYCYGHKAQGCQHVTCGHCAEEHDTHECPNTAKEPTCVHCKVNGKEVTNHQAYNRKCPFWQRFDLISRHGINYC